MCWKYFALLSCTVFITTVQANFLNELAKIKATQMVDELQRNDQQRTRDASTLDMRTQCENIAMEIANKRQPIELMPSACLKLAAAAQQDSRQADPTAPYTVIYERRTIAGPVQTYLKRTYTEYPSSVMPAQRSVSDQGRMPVERLVPIELPASNQPTVQMKPTEEASFNGMPQSTPATTISVNRRETQEMDNQKFNNDLYQLISMHNPQINFVYSPISLQTTLALVYTGASGQTASELQNALGLPSDKRQVYQQFGSLPKSQRTGDMQLQMANKIYYSEDLSLNLDFKDNARQYFDADIERVNFANAPVTAKQINQWVASKTNQRIRNIVDPNGLDSSTRAILLNAIYFKAKWATEFSVDDTKRDQFIVGGQKMPVEMMNNEDSFLYAELNNIGARVLELPYKDTDLSMLIVLPNDVNGLAAVESRMQNIDMRNLPQQMRMETVKLQLPKFRVEFELDMVEALRRLQVSRVFTDRAELNSIFPGKSAGISKVQHKAYIDVNEAGSEAAAVTFTKFVPLSLPSNLKDFRVDHPFMFAIRSPHAVYFVGHVVNV